MIHRATRWTPYTMSHATFTLLLIIVSAATVLAHKPMYDNLRYEIDSFSDRMKTAFEKFGVALDHFQSRLDNLDGNLSSTVAQFSESLTGLEGKIKDDLESILSQNLTDMNRRTKRSFAELKGEMNVMQQDTADVTSRMRVTQETTGRMLDAITSLSKDYGDFQKKTAGLWDMHHNMTSLRESVQDSLHNVSMVISDMGRDLVETMTTTMGSLQLSLPQQLAEIDKHIQNTGRRNECPVKWSRFENSCYLFMKEEQSWKIAKFACEQLNSHLAEIYTDDENRFVSSLVGNETTEVWCGANIGRKGTWYWTGSKSEVNFDLFSGKYISGRNREYCALLLPASLSIEDKNCGKKRYFLCRKFQPAL